jgi:PAS domain-containing protein
MTPMEYRGLDEREMAAYKAEGGARPPIEKEYVRKDGTRIAVMVAGAVVDEARFNGVAFALDVTRCKQAEGELARKAALLEAVFRAQHDVVLVYDSKMDVLQANPPFLQTYGFNPVGLHVRDIVQRVSCRWLDGRSFVWEEQPTPKALAGERVTGARFVVTGKDGAELAVETSSGPISMSLTLRWATSLMRRPAEYAIVSMARCLMFSVSMMSRRTSPLSRITGIFTGLFSRGILSISHGRPRVTV